MSLAAKLQLKSGQKIRMVGAPSGVKLDLPRSDGAADAVLLFVTDRRALKAHGKPFLEAARADRLAWLAYPKAGQLGTDLDRDTLWELLKAERIRPVRQIAIDDVWSALRFRPA